MNDKEHVLFCVMAESAAGKDTLVNRLCQISNFTQLISYTTRPQRQNEGATHIFVDEDFYLQTKQNNEIAAYTYINNNHYWSTIDQLYDSDFYVIDPIGVESLKALNLPNLRIVTVYINVPEDVRKQRAMERGDNPNVYRARCISERNQFKDMKKNMDVDYVIPNVNKANAISVLKWIANVEGLWMNHAEDNFE
jgi:guanylate kinase